MQQREGLLLPPGLGRPVPTRPLEQGLTKFLGRVTQTCTTSTWKMFVCQSGWQGNHEGLRLVVAALPWSIPRGVSAKQNAFASGTHAGGCLSLL